MGEAVLAEKFFQALCGDQVVLELEEDPREGLRQFSCLGVVNAVSCQFQGLQIVVVFQGFAERSNGVL